MSKFIELSDYDASVHRDILDALTRNDKAIVEICEDRAIAEIRGYISGHYDCDKLFSATGGDRNQLVLMMALDITIYHIFSIHNPQKLSQLRKDRYDRAVEWMRAVKKGMSIDGAPELEKADRKSTYKLQSNRKRINHY